MLKVPRQSFSAARLWKWISSTSWNWKRMEVWEILRFLTSMALTRTITNSAQFRMKAMRCAPLTLLKTDAFKNTTTLSKKWFRQTKKTTKISFKRFDRPFLTYWSHFWFALTILSTRKRIRMTQILCSLSILIRKGTWTTLKEKLRRISQKKC